MLDYKTVERGGVRALVSDVQAIDRWAVAASAPVHRRGK